MMDPELIRIIEDNNLQLHGDIEYFAEMVAAHEREACAKLAAEISYRSLPNFDKAPSELMMGRIEGERSTSRKIADAIRARGKA